MSHGDMAVETLKSAELIVGQLPETVALGLHESDGPDTLKAKVVSEIEKYYQKEPIYLLVDLLGGTPGNVAVNLTQDYPELHVISGLNLPMVLNYANQMFIGEEIKIADIMNEGKAGIVDVNAFINADASEDDEDE